MTVSSTLHLVSDATDEVFRFLMPATRELSLSGRLQTIVLVERPDHAESIAELRRHATVVLVKKRGGWYATCAELHRVCREQLASRPSSTLHLHGALACVIGASAANRQGDAARIFYFPHGFRPTLARRVGRWLGLQAARSVIRPSRVSAIATSAVESRALRAWGSAHLLESPVQDLFLQAIHEEAADPLVLGGGTLSSAGASEILSQIAVLLSAEELRINFRWLGSVSPDTASRFQAANVEIVDIADDDVHVRELSRGWVYVAPWKESAYPAPLIQAMAGAVPCVALDCPRHRQVIEHGVNGFLYKSEDEMVKTIALLLDDPDLRRSIGHAARESAKARFGSHNFRLKLLGHYLSDAQIAPLEPQGGPSPQDFHSGRSRLEKVDR